jgi:hypothetical protein
MAKATPNVLCTLCLRGTGSCGRPVCVCPCYGCDQSPGREHDPDPASGAACWMEAGATWSCDTCRAGGGAQHVAGCARAGETRTHREHLHCPACQARPGAECASTGCEYFAGTRVNKHRAAGAHPNPEVCCYCAFPVTECVFAPCTYGRAVMAAPNP